MKAYYCLRIKVAFDRKRIARCASVQVRRKFRIGASIRSSRQSSIRKYLPADEISGFADNRYNARMEREARRAKL